MLKKISILTVLALGLLIPKFVSATTAPPISDKSYAGKYVSQSIADPIVIEAGNTKEVVVKIKNTGKITWKAAGLNYVSIYTIEPNYRASVFYDKTSWVHNDQPAKLRADTKPGAVGEFRIKLKAPTKLGDYTEKFFLVSENHTWIQGTYFFFKIKVVKNTKPVATSEALGNSAGEVDAAVDSGEYASHLLALSSKNLEIAQGGDNVNFIVRYTNDGAKEWTKYIWQEAGSMALDNSAVPNISDPSWQSRKIIESGNNTIKPGDPLEFGFVFKAPRLKGDYILRFQLMANDHTTSGGTLELPVKILADAPSDYAETVWQTARTLVSEPNIRVGLYKDSKPIKFQSNFRYEVLAGGVSKGWLEPTELATLSYQQGVYTFVGGSLDFSGHGFIRLVPEDKEAYFTLTNYDREVSWKGNKNFNVYRGVLEYVYSPKSAMPYVINELPLDAYIAGIGETSNGAAMEYIKAILVAARSYAYKNILASVSSPSPSFDVFPTTVDQLYLGYNSEVLMPRVVQAAQATYGEMVIYDGNPVTTPYFGNSNGWTRGWKEVWGGTDKPWLQPVECIYDKGKSMFGHGVGMSAYDASRRAAEDGWTYDQILKYYYTGVGVERVY